MPGRPWYTISSAAGTDAAPDYQTQASLDGTTDTGANSSSAQRRARAPPLPHSRNSARQSRVNVVPFRPPRNERRLAPSSDMGDTRAPATRTEHWDRDEFVDVYSEDEDYDPETDEVESFDDHVDDLFAGQEAEHQGNANSCKDIDFWEVDVIENSVTQQKEIAELEAQLAEMKAKRQIMERLLRYLIQQQGDNLPPDVVAELDSLGSAQNGVTQQKEYQKKIVELKAEVAELKTKVAEEKAKRQTTESLFRYLFRQQDNLPPDVAADLDSLGSAPTLFRARSSSGTNDLHDKS